MSALFEYFFCLAAHSKFSRSVFRNGYQVTAVLMLSPSGRPVVLGYAVQPNREDWDYLPLLESLRDLGVNPETVMSDFEQAIQNAVQQVWPKARFRKCLFHFKQAIRRWLEKNFDASSEAALRPQLENLIDAMAKTASVAEFERALSKLCSLKNPKAKKFAEYFVTTYIERFPPTGWAYCYAKSAEEREHLTNNIAERFPLLLRFCCERKILCRHNQLVQGACPGGKLSLAQGCTHLGEILRIRQGDAVREMREVSLTRVLDAKEALDILARSTNRQSQTMPAPARQRSHLYQILPAAVQRILDVHQLELTIDALEVNGECFLQVCGPVFL